MNWNDRGHAKYRESKYFIKGPTFKKLCNSGKVPGTLANTNMEHTIRVLPVIVPL